jgi:pimeloyl-ACP methyl ester carboxylesterase
MNGRAVVAFVASAAAIALVTGCGSGGPRTPASSPVPPPSLPASAAGVHCASDVAGGRQVRFGAGGRTDLGGVVFGAGRVGIAFANQANGEVCDWAGYARELGRRGYRTLVFDFSGTGASATAAGDTRSDLEAAVAYLRGDGVETVVLMGASMGGTTAVATAAEPGRPVAGVVSLSAPRNWMNTNAEAAAPKLTVPVLYLVGEQDKIYADESRMLAAETPAALSKLVVVDSSSHGVGLLKVNAFDGEPPVKTVRTEIDAFLKKVAPVS